MRKPKHIRSQARSSAQGEDVEEMSPSCSQTLTTRLRNNLSLLEQYWSTCTDLKRVSTSIQGFNVEILYLAGTVDKVLLHENIIVPLDKLLWTEPQSLERFQSPQPVQRTRDISQINKLISGGNVVVLVDGFNVAICVDISKFSSRSVDVSQNEPTIQGPQQAFTENLESSIAQVRNIVRTPNLKVDGQIIGTVSSASVSLLYIDGIVNEHLVTEATERLRHIELHGALDTNYIAEMISDAQFSLFPTVEKSERPDKVAAGLLEGRFAILMAGSPTALLYPTTITYLLHAGDDYYGNFTMALPIRIVRYLLFWLSMLLPSFYVGVLAFQKDLIPTPLLLNLGKQHEGIPFNSAIEAFLIMLAFETVREGGQRLPRTLGLSVSILGALIIGETAVSAGFVTPGMVIVVAITGIASFTIPSYSLVNAVRIMQFIFLGASALFGLIGMLSIWIMLVAHLASLRSFGEPYLSPFGPLSLDVVRDTLVRAPWGYFGRHSPEVLSANRGNHVTRSREK